MASIGLGLMQGAMLADQAKTQNENLSILKAGRKLFDAQLKETEATTEYLSQANEQARQAKKSILNNRERILIGDPAGTANVLRDTVYRDFDGKVTVDPATKEVVIISKDGKEVERQKPLMGMDGVAKLMQLGDTIDQVYAANVAAQQTAQQRAYEMTKMREEKGFDYKKAVDVAGIGANAQLGAASMGANATLGSAGLRAGVDKYKANLDFQKALHTSTLENLDKIERAKWVQANAAAAGVAPTLDSSTNNLVLASLSPDQAAQALNYYSGMTSLSGNLGPGAMPAQVYADEVLRGRSDSAMNTQTMFNAETQMPLGIPSLTFNTGFSGSGNPYNNFGFNLGGQQLGAVQLLMEQRAQTAAAAEAARQTRALEQARAYGYIR